MPVASVRLDEVVASSSWLTTCAAEMNLRLVGGEVKGLQGSEVT